MSRKSGSWRCAIFIFSHIVIDNQSFSCLKVLTFSHCVRVEHPPTPPSQTQGNYPSAKAQEGNAHVV